MTSKLTQEELDGIGKVAAQIMESVYPTLLKLIAASRPSSKVEAIGSLLSVEPADRVEWDKELWVTTYTTVVNDRGTDTAAIYADRALKAFNQRFEKSNHESFSVLNCIVGGQKETPQ